MALALACAPPARQVGERTVSVEMVESVLVHGTVASPTESRRQAMKRWLSRAGSGHADVANVSSIKNEYLAEIYATKP